MTTTNVDRGRVAFRNCVNIDALLSFAAEDTFAEGTILARKLTSADTYAGVIVGTGAKTIALTPRAGRSMKVGAYVLTVGNVTAGVGPATLVDPDGISETTTLATSGAHQFPNLGVTMTITAGGTELDDNATVTFTVAAPSSDTFVPYSATGTNGAQVPSAVLGYEQYKATGGTLSARVIVSGEVTKERLVIDGVGAATLAVLEQLRSFGIVPVSVDQLTAYDNQPA
jgi:malic enzyme